MIKLLIIHLFLLFPLFLSAQEVDLLILNNEYDKALKLIDEKLTEDEAQAALHLKKGIILQKQFDYTAAMKSLQKAYQLDTLNPGILSEIADLNSNLGDHKTALSFLKILYQNDSTNSVKTLKLVRGYSNLRIYDKPFKILQSAYRRDSSNLMINKSLALSAVRIGQNDLAIRLYLKIIKQNPSDLASFLNIASAYQNKKEDANVIAILEYGLRFFPDEPQLLMKLGDFQFQSKKYSRAVITYEKLLASGDSIQPVIKNLGISYFYVKKPAKGTYLLEKSLHNVPNDPVAALYLGLCYKDLHQIKKSIEWLKFAAETAVPGYLADIYHHLGYVYSLNKEYRKAIPVLQKAYEINPSQNDLLFEIATTSENLNENISSSIKYYDAYLKSVKQDNPDSKKFVDFANERKKVLKKELANKNIKSACN